MTPESEVKKYLRDELGHVSKLLGIPITVLANPGSVSGQIGRDDCDVVVAGLFYFHCEIKREEIKTADIAQDIFADKFPGMFRMVVVGKSGVDRFISELPILLQKSMPYLMINMNSTVGVLNDKFGDYLQNKQQRQSAADKRPKRQSKKLDPTLH